MSHEAGVLPLVETAFMRHDYSFSENANGQQEADYLLF